MRRAGLGLLLLLLAGAGFGYEAGEAEWRASYEARLRSENGWLAVAGLFWLEEGSARFGTAADNELVFPSGPALAGTIERRGRVITLRVTPGVDVKIGGAPVSTKVLAPDTSGAPDVVTMGRLSFMIIERNGRFGLRLRDPENPRRTGFPGTTWFPADTKYRIVARFEPHRQARTLPVPNVLGDVIDMENPGRVRFRVGGRQVTLEAVREGPDELFFIFSDGTSGRTTYPGGRFLYAPSPVEGKVILDFNRATSPPCAYTDFATCPLPPKPNRLRVAIPAGEKYVH